jgi:mycofactocin precursor
MLYASSNLKEGGMMGKTTPDVRDDGDLKALDYKDEEPKIIEEIEIEELFIDGICGVY